jgi:hypothetical protein
MSCTQRRAQTRTPFEAPSYIISGAGADADTEGVGTRIEHSTSRQLLIAKLLLASFT